MFQFHQQLKKNSSIFKLKLKDNLRDMLFHYKKNLCM